MLVRITNQCHMECSHCIVNATPDGEHMSMDTYKKVLDFTAQYDPTLLFLSGGEPTEHPNFLEFAYMAIDYVRTKKIGFILCASNGMFLDDEKYAKEILKLGINLQITNDSEFYPKRIKFNDDPHLTYVNKLTVVTPLGRAANLSRISTCQSPMCFNLRSIVSHLRDLGESLKYLRSRIKMCSPSINVDGTLVAGEAPSCHAIGTVQSTGEEITKNILNIQCGRCGLQKNLKGQLKILWDGMEGL